MLTIYKYDISHPIEVPISAALLKVAMQDNCITAWYCIDTDDTKFTVDKFHCIGTGWDLENYPDIDYVDTLFDNEGFVWHIYQEVR